MSNQFKSKIEEIQEENEAVFEPKVKQKSDFALPANNFFHLLFVKGVVSKEAATDALPFILFLSFLALIYIGNRHSAENNIREIDKLNKEVKELSWDFKTLKADLMFKSKQTEVVSRVDTLLQLKVPVTPPVKIVVAPNEY
ncbi:MAG: hypothetical protein EAZ51_08250 [Sphingobacteriales bacterium]|nr:MAG: hypothetical protein EAZ64_02870 [Sphingobacteriales bacterium]TAF79099.1 MAG: hypothetical protein EAZ51_08250 [Sphingobacteriales bacterium]